MKIKKKDAFQFIIACTCKEETALYPGVGVYLTVRYVLFWTRAGMVSTDVRPPVVPPVNILFFISTKPQTSLRIICGITHTCVQVCEISAQLR